MKRASIISYGVIPLYKSPDGLRVLVVEQFGAQGTHWGFPKGKPVPGERPQDTAKREAREEVGVQVKEFIDGVQLTQNYSFTYDDTIVDKTVHYMVGYVASPGLALQEKEVRNARWCSLDEGRNLLSFMNTKTMFDTAVAYIEEYEQTQL